MLLNFKGLIFSQLRDILNKNMEVYYACML